MNVKKGVSTLDIIKVYFVYYARQRRFVFGSPWILIPSVLPYNSSRIILQEYGGILLITVVSITNIFETTFYMYRMDV